MQITYKKKKTFTIFFINKILKYYKKSTIKNSNQF